MVSYLMNICTKNHQNLIIGFQVSQKVGDVFLGQCNIIIIVMVKNLCVMNNGL